MRRRSQIYPLSAFLCRRAKAQSYDSAGPCCNSPSDKPSSDMSEIFSGATCSTKCTTCQRSMSQLASLVFMCNVLYLANRNEETESLALPMVASTRTTQTGPAHCTVLLSVLQAQAHCHCHCKASEPSNGPGQCQEWPTHLIFSRTDSAVADRGVQLIGRVNTLINI